MIPVPAPVCHVIISYCYWSILICSQWYSFDRTEVEKTVCFGGSWSLTPNSQIGWAGRQYSVLLVYSPDPSVPRTQLTISYFLETVSCSLCHFCVLISLWFLCHIEAYSADFYQSYYHSNVYVACLNFPS